MDRVIKLFVAIILGVIAFYMVLVFISSFFMFF